MTLRKPFAELKKSQSIMGWLKNIEHHRFKERRLCSSSKYNDLMSSAKAEFDDMERRQKANNVLNKKAQFSANTGLPKARKTTKTQTSASA